MDTYWGAERAVCLITSLRPSPFMSRMSAEAEKAESSIWLDMRDWLESVKNPVPSLIQSRSLMSSPDPSPS